jgi:pimeloyl-ACP methyl ester carboxylesterase
MPDLRAQADLLARLIPEGRRAIVVGHSLGGPLVAWLAIDHPDKVCGAVSIAGSLAADLEQPRWYNQAARLWPVQWLIPQEMNWSNEEMMPLAGELRKLQAAWPRLRTPMILVQGGKDPLVDPRTADVIGALAPRQWLTVESLPQEDHFVLWKKPDLVIDAILRLPCAKSPMPARAAASAP